MWKLLGTKLLFSTAYHLQTDSQTEVTNRTLAILLRSLVSKSLKDWDLKLPHAEFAYNRSPSYATKHSPLSVFMELTLLLPWICYQFQLSQELGLKLRLRPRR